MQVDALVVALRPRSMMEAADLGVRLVQANARSIWSTFAPVYGVVLALALAMPGNAVWLPALVIFCFKPWFDRSLLFALSRAVFGQPTTLADLWRVRGSVWLRRLPSTFTILRLSPWRSFTLALDQLENQRGAALSARRRLLLGGQGTDAALMQFAFANLEFALVLGGWMLALWLAPPGHQNEAWAWIGRQMRSPLGVLPYAAVVLMVEPFYVGAGFAMYLNRRVQLEAWDVEQEFRHLFA